MAQSPLLERNLTSPLGLLTRDCCDFPLQNGPLHITANQFLAQAHFLSAQLPERKYFVNLVDNRYLFLLAMCAALLRGSTCLLPQNRTPKLREFIASHYPDAVTLHDDARATREGMDLSMLPLLAQSPSFGGEDIPQIADSQLAVICFTSGSTGDPKPIRKTWRALRESSRINRRYFCSARGETPVFHYAGVPQQHMWGLETTVFLPLFSEVCTVDAHAALPGDIMHQLAQLPRPLTFIGTPLHLKSLQALQRNSRQTGERDSIRLDRILCATSPLDERLAADVEEQFATEVHEIYGCSEIGSMAHRRTARTAMWTRFHGINFEDNASGSTIASTAHLDDSVELGDRLELLDGEQFKLLGRGDDLIKVAGKRGSLGDVNKTLQRYEGLVDGVIFLPEFQHDAARLTAIVSLNSAGNREGLMRHLRENLDSTFVPRPVYIVDKLPRQANGKLPKDTLLSLHNALKAKAKTRN
ncbi:MAG: AMP-binding protein [Congregibacter sp.]